MTIDEIERKHSINKDDYEELKMHIEEIAKIANKYDYSTESSYNASINIFRRTVSKLVDIINWVSHEK